jgi:hypothetical protein
MYARYLRIGFNILLIIGHDILVSQLSYSQQPFTYMDYHMKSEDSEYLNELTPEIVNSNSDPVLVNRLLGIIEDLQNEVKRLKRTQGFDVVKGKRQKPLNYVASKDKI